MNAVIIGGTSGLGLELAKQFVAQGVQYICILREPGRVEEVETR